MVLSNPSGAKMDDDTGEGTITDNELPELSIGNALVEEGRNGPVRGEVESRPGAPDGDYGGLCGDGGRHGTGRGADYTSESGTLTFSAGQTMMTISVPTQTTVSRRWRNASR